MPKRRSKAKNIIARSITLTDSKGKTRIYMGVHDNGYSSICLFGPRERSIEISADHEGGLHVSLRGGEGKVVAGLGITADNHVGITLCDHRTRSRTELGSGGSGEPHHVTIYYRGRIRWTTRERTRGKKRR